jgi:hypothetical protein
VIDCDTPRGRESPCWRLLDDAVEVAGHRLPRTFAVRTPRGGLHLYFTAPDQRLGNSAGKLGVGIDTRGAGGYVVGPGSVYRGRYYRIIDRSPVMSVPEWIIEALKPTATAVPTARSVELHRDSYVRAILEGEAERVRAAAPGSRNNALNVSAFILGQLVGGAKLSESEARAILWHAVRTHLGVDGFNTDEAERTITSGLTGGALRPRWVREHS